MLYVLLQAVVYLISYASLCCWANRATSGLHFLELVSLDALVTAMAEDAPQVSLYTVVLDPLIYQL